LTGSEYKFFNELFKQNKKQDMIPEISVKSIL